MFKTLRDAWSIAEIRKKLLYTLLMLLIFRLGSAVVVPFLDTSTVSTWMASNATGGNFLEYLDIITGGALSQATGVSLSITPYINASIIMQLLTIAIPKLEEMQKEGVDGRKKLTALTRYVTVVLALIESTAMAVGFGRQGLLEKFNFVNATIVVLTLTAGSAFLMWIGERFTE